MARLVRWDTPFSDKLFPSATVIVGYDPDGKSDLLSAVVAPDGIDHYPKYLIHFGEVVAFACMEEMHFPERSDFTNLNWDGPRFSSYEFLESTWLQSYKAGEYFLFNVDGGDSETLHHYVIAGGDNNIEVISKNVPTIETISEPTDIEIRIPI